MSQPRKSLSNRVPWPRLARELGTTSVDDQEEIEQPPTAHGSADHHRPFPFTEPIAFHVGMSDGVIARGPLWHFGGNEVIRMRQEFPQVEFDPCTLGDQAASAIMCSRSMRNCGLLRVGGRAA